jgi:hypothetical protein
MLYVLLVLVAVVLVAWCYYRILGTALDPQKHPSIRRMARFCAIFTPVAIFTQYFSVPEFSEYYLALLVGVALVLLLSAPTHR